ncbi:hypothetical protein Hanom_Chr15g01373601 [Helianthus anomalus]
MNPSCSSSSPIFVLPRVLVSDSCSSSSPIFGYFTDKILHLVI